MATRDNLGIKNDIKVTHAPKFCVICNTEFVAHRNDAEVCSAACRQKNWRKKKDMKNNLATDPLSDLIEVRKEQDAFCERSGFPTSQLIEKFQQLEAKNGELLEKIKWLKAENITLTNTNTNLSIEVDSLKEDAATWRLRMAQTAEAINNNPPAFVTTTSDKPNTASKPYDGQLQGARMPIIDDLPAGSEPLTDFKARIKANAGKSTEKGLNATTVEESAKDTPKNKPAGLSSFMKARQALKNGQK